MSLLALVSIAQQHKDGTLDPVEADSLSGEMRVRCVGVIERYRAEHGTTPNGLVIETTDSILTTYQMGSESARR